MFKKVILITFGLLLISAPVFAVTQSAEFLCELGISFYQRGRYNEAITEFKKVLMIDPSNKTAQHYVNNIFQSEAPAPWLAQKEKPVLASPPKNISREKIINDTLNKLVKDDDFDRKLERPAYGDETEPPVSGLKLTGEAQASFGVTSQDGIWKQANGDLNEENWRTLSESAYNKRANTYDTRIYDRIRVNVDGANESGLGFHSNLTVDPWSFTGKSDKFTIGGSGTTDVAEMELKYWANTGYAINQSVYTLRDGASIAVPEMKVVNGHTPETIVESTWIDPFSSYLVIPETKINYEFQPLRELWLDYKQEGLNFRFFPIAYGDQALTTDDPLKLSNNHIWWEASPWLYKWSPGRLNSGVATPDFTAGENDSSLASFTKDSDGTRLTALRGFSFDFQPQEETSFATTVAAPKDLWQDYDSFDSLSSATRIKHLLTDALSIGTVYTFREGFNEDNSNKKDYVDHVVGADIGYEVVEGLKFSAEAVKSFSENDLSSPGYASKASGNAYYFSLVGRYPQTGIMDLDNGYDGIKPESSEGNFTKFRLFGARMDKGFDSALSNYTETRDDAFWSRHIHFRKPFEYYYAGLYYPSMGWDDIEPFRIGNGIDNARSVIGFRLENSLWDSKFDNLFDVRNVHDTNGKYIENVARDEITHKTTDKLTTKVLGLYHNLPKTTGGFDPFIVDSATASYLKNTAIVDGLNPSLKTGSLGLEYAFFDWLSLNGIWECTNDYTLAYDNFPRGNLNSTSFTTTGSYDKTYRLEDPYLYSQALFPLPPYHFYNIYKTGLRLNFAEKLDIYLDYTRNEFKSAGQIDDNINHIGFEASYFPVKKLGLYFRYTYSRWNDLNLMQQGYSKYYLGHHNIGTEFRYLPALDNEFVMQYGESGRSTVSTATFDPFGTALPTLDTQHIFRLFYRKKF